MGRFGHRLLPPLAFLALALSLSIAVLDGRAAVSQVRVEIWNGNGVAGVAQEASEGFGESPFRVVRLGDAPTFRYGQTFVLYRSGFEEAARQLAAGLPVTARLRQMGGLPPDVDIRLLLGKDYAVQKSREEEARAEEAARAEAARVEALALAKAAEEAEAFAREREAAEARELALAQAREREAAARREAQAREREVAAGREAQAREREAAVRREAQAREREVAAGREAQAREREAAARQEAQARETVATRTTPGRASPANRRVQPVTSRAASPPAPPRGLRVELSNGNGVGGMASRVKRYLNGFGIAVASLSNAESFDYPRSVIFYRRGLREEARALASVLPVGNVALEESNLQGIDMRIVLGQDLVAYDINRLREESPSRDVAGN